MGYLNNTVITVDAVLTSLGRAALARNDGSFTITQFSLADDEIDYTEYNPTHPSGSAFFGEAIEKSPLLEAFPDENQMMKYKLLTLPRGTSKLPVLQVGFDKIVLKQGASLVITPQTLNYQGTSVFESSGYIATVSDARLLATFTGIGIDTSTLGPSQLNTTTSTNLTKSQIGTSFTLVGTTINTLFGNLNQLSTQITFIGRDSGARISMPLIINKNN